MSNYRRRPGEACQAMPSLNESVSSLCAKCAFLVQIMFGYDDGFCKAAFFFFFAVVFSAYLVLLD